MTCRFVPTKQPKRETTLVRLTRQARAVERLVDRHNKQVNVTANRIMRVWVSGHKQQAKSKARLAELEALAESIRNLELGDC